MSDLQKAERIILELTNIKPRSRKYLQNKLYALVGASNEQVDKTIRELVAKDWLTENSETYISNPNSNFYLYPPEIDELMSNGKAIHKVITLANQAYYPNLKFDEFINNHLQKSVDRDYVKRILIAAYNKGIIKGLPIELRKSGFTYRIKQIRGRFIRGINWIDQHPIIKLMGAIVIVAGFYGIVKGLIPQEAEILKFNKEEWNISLEFNHNKREKMVDDLIENYLYSGMHFIEVTELLGTKDSYRTDPPGSILYGLYDDYGMDIVPLNQKP